MPLSTEFLFGLALVIAYLIGCLATGYYLVLFLSGQDVRQTGSGGAGARNVGRLLGRRAAIATAAGDASKGALAVALFMSIAPVQFSALYGLLAVTAGHIWPLQLGFRGGKGVATSLGALLVCSPGLFAVFAGVFLTLLALTRRATLSVVAAYGVLPLTAAAFGKPLTDLLLLSGLSASIIYLHRAAALLEWRAGAAT